MSGTWTGSSVMAVPPSTPSPFRMRVVRRASARASPASVATRWTNSSALSSYSNTTPPSNPDNSTARATIVVRTVSRSSAELTAPDFTHGELIDGASWRRSGPPAPGNNRTFSTAMTAWSAKVLKRSTSASEIDSDPAGLRESHQRLRRRATLVPRANYGIRAGDHCPGQTRSLNDPPSGIWTTERMRIAVPAAVVMSRGRGNSARAVARASGELP
jgi:hypothetical protein